MADLTIRGLPDELNALLRQRAEANHRSVNRETIALIERAMKGEATAKPRMSAEQVMALAEDFARLPVLDERPISALLPYDENGLPI